MSFDPYGTRNYPGLEGGRCRFVRESGNEDQHGGRMDFNKKRKL